MGLVWKQLVFLCEVDVPVWWGTTRGTWWETAAWTDPCAARLQETGWGGWWEPAAGEASCWADARTSWWTGCWATTAAGSCWGTPGWTGYSTRRTDLLGQKDKNQIHQQNSCAWMFLVFKSETLDCIVQAGMEGMNGKRAWKKRADCPKPERGLKFLRGVGARPSWTVSDMRGRQCRQRGRSEREQQWVWSDLWVNKSETERSLRQTLIMYDRLAQKHGACLRCCSSSSHIWKLNIKANTIENQQQISLLFKQIFSLSKEEASEKRQTSCLGYEHRGRNVRKTSQKTREKFFIITSD